MHSLNSIHFGLNVFDIDDSLKYLTDPALQESCPRHINNQDYFEYLATRPSGDYFFITSMGADSLKWLVEHYEKIADLKVFGVSLHKGSAFFKNKLQEPLRQFINHLYDYGNAEESAFPFKPYLELVNSELSNHFEPIDYKDIPPDISKEYLPGGQGFTFKKDGRQVYLWNKYDLAVCFTPVAEGESAEDIPPEIFQPAIDAFITIQNKFHAQYPQAQSEFYQYDYKSGPKKRGLTIGLKEAGMNKAKGSLRAYQGIAMNDPYVVTLIDNKNDFSIGKPNTLFNKPNYTLFNYYNTPNLLEELIDSKNPGQLIVIQVPGQPDIRTSLHPELLKRLVDKHGQEAIQVSRKAGHQLAVQRGEKSLLTPE